MFYQFKCVVSSKNLRTHFLRMLKWKQSKLLVHTHRFQTIKKNNQNTFPSLSCFLYLSMSVLYFWGRMLLALFFSFCCFCCFRCCSCPVLLIIILFGSISSFSWPCGPTDAYGTIIQCKWRFAGTGRHSDMRAPSQLVTQAWKRHEHDMKRAQNTWEGIWGSFVNNTYGIPDTEFSYTCEMQDCGCQLRS